MLREKQFIDGTATPYTTTGNWDTRRGLLYKLMRYSELPAGDADAADYLDDNETAASSPWKFTRAEHLFDQAYVLSTSLQSGFASMSARFRVLCDTLVLLDVQQAQDTTTLDPTIAQKRSNIFDKIVVTADSLERLRALANLSVQPALQSALNYIQNLPDGQVYEDNLKEVLTIAVRYAQGDSLTGSDLTTLRGIAAQCPATGGIGIRRAPLWLEHDEAVEYIDKEWDDNCVSALVGNNEPLIEPFGLKVTPNPANKYTRIHFPANCSGDWHLTELTGRLVRKGDIGSPAVDINTSDLVNGLYLLSCRFSTGVTSTIKISICH